MPEYPIGKIVFGSAASIDAAYRLFRELPIDETRLAPNRASPFPACRRTLVGEAPVAGIGTFQGSRQQTLTFAPRGTPGWWIRRMDERAEPRPALRLAPQLPAHGRAHRRAQGRPGH